MVFSAALFVLAVLLIGGLMLLQAQRASHAGYERCGCLCRAIAWIGT